MNLADLTAVLVTLCGAIIPLLCAIDSKVSWWALPIFLIAGVLYGIVMGLAAGRIAYWLLNTPGNGLRAKAASIAYLLFPVPALGLSIMGAMALSDIALR